MDLLSLAQRRYSCRKYQEKPVEREKLTACVEAVGLSPSACNSQRWMVIVVDDPQICAQVAEGIFNPDMGINTHVKETPAFAVFVKEPMAAMNDFQKKMLGADNYWDLDMGIAIQSFCLAATDMGLGTVIMGGLGIQQDMLRKALDIPASRVIIAVVGVGYPVSNDVRKKNRNPQSQYLRYNNYNQNQ